jgi:hypothetical protein
MKQKTNKSQRSEQELKKSNVSQFRPIILAFGRLRQKDLDFQTCLGYVARPSFLKKKRMDRCSKREELF